MTGIRIPIIPRGAISGRIVDETGTPVEDAQVNIFRVGLVRGELKVIGSWGTSPQSDDRGIFRFAKLAPGKYVVQTVWRATIPDTADTQWTPTFYPGVASLAEAVPIQVTPGAERTLDDLRLRRAGLFRVKGTVLLSGRPIERGGISVRSRDIGTIGHQGSVGRSEFGLRLPAGEYTLTARSSGMRNDAYAEFPFSVLAHDVEGMVFSIPEAQTLSGRVSLAGSPEVDLSGVSISLEDAGRSAQVNRKGEFSLPGLYPRKYRIRVERMPDGAWLRSIRLGEQVVGRDLDLSAGLAGQVEIMLAPGAGRIAGRVLDQEKPEAGATVVVATATGEFLVATADASGGFEFSGLAPGDYRVYAWDEIERGAWQDSEALAAFESVSTPVHIELNGTASIRVPSIRNTGTI
jgi:hypothetical protein